jgi:hypothetical protein
MRFELTIPTLAEVHFHPNGKHSLLDHGYGSVEWDEQTPVVCQANCGWAGTLGEANEDQHQHS